ncbi:hypothetical protein [Secundilactobacillus folii]|uniref:Uncharacterized protein n=1 Tax=Secundilactobacillus folii TaxID=2678357 RepID=A0A7X2XWP3_9LACO|nr:hypothetical protein [Secundilactobacillus folii]MTV82983.1 hypothetical protein [Secundilactobacillus folii]
MAQGHHFKKKQASYHWFTVGGTFLFFFEILKPIIKWLAHVTAGFWAIIWSGVELLLIWLIPIIVVLMIMRFVFWLLGVNADTPTDDSWDSGYDNGWLDSWAMHSHDDDNWHDIY